MCGGIEAREADKIWRIYVPNPKAALPVMLEDSGQMDWITWGRRKEQQGYEPQGGWAKLSTVQAGGWENIAPAVASAWCSVSWRRRVSQAKRIGHHTGLMSQRATRWSAWSLVKESSDGYMS